MTKPACYTIIQIDGGTTKRRLSPRATRSKPKRWGTGGLLLFYGGNNHADNADYHKAELKQLWICNHKHPLLSQEGKRKSPSQGMGGDNRLETARGISAAGSATG